MAGKPGAQRDEIPKECLTQLEALWKSFQTMAAEMQAISDKVQDRDGTSEISESSGFPARTTKLVEPAAPETEMTKEPEPQLQQDVPKRNHQQLCQ